MPVPIMFEITSAVALPIPSWREQGVLARWDSCRQEAHEPLND